MIVNILVFVATVSVSQIEELVSVSQIEELTRTIKFDMSHFSTVTYIQNVSIFDGVIRDVL